MTLINLTNRPSASLSFPFQNDEIHRRRENALRQHSFFQLKVHLVSGHNLTAMDKSGTSDPYVKFKQGGRLLFKSKTVHKELNPTFDETFSVPIEDPFQTINVKVRRMAYKPFSVMIIFILTRKFPHAPVL
jgi:hypothetical protein